MKILPDQLESVRLDQTSQTGKAAQTGSAFGDVLSQELGSAGAQSTPTSPLASLDGLGALNTLMGVQDVEATSEIKPTGNEIMNKVESVLDKWDQYAQNLQSTGSAGSLKQAYGVLDDIDGAVRQIKGDNPDLASNHPALQGVVSEIEALTVTERIKFNRGDYTA